MSSRSRDNNIDVTRRLLVAGGVGGLVAGGIGSRLAYLQLFSDDKFVRLADENGLSREPAPSRRGLIYDRFGEPLATHRTSWNVYAARENIDDVPALLKRISQIVEFSDEQIERVLRDFSREQRFIPVSILSDLTYEQFARLSVERPSLPGVAIDEVKARSYPRGRDFAHVLGYVARPNQREIDQAIENLDPEKDREQINRIKRVYKHPTMRIGRLGMEKQADDWLRGTPGVYRFVKNAQGRILERLPDDETAPKPGSDIHLTIDAGLQKAAIEHFEDQTGAAVVIDIENGDILTLASTPAFDPNDFVNGISVPDYAALRDDERAPLFHKAYDGVYPPGSTFKMIVGSAALRAGVVTPNERVYCSGRYNPFGGRAFHCWKRGGHGHVDLHTAIQGSCDVYFYEVARRLGPDLIAEEAKTFGLGHDYTLGMTGGREGVVPTDAWKRKRFGEPWYAGETLSYGIGQGYLTTSPLQLAVMCARIAAGDGSQIMPRLIGNGPSFDKDTPYGTMPSTDILDRLRAAMYAVTSEPGGTALRAGDIGYQGIRMAGKTGTAQVRVISTAERATGVIGNADLPRRLRDHGLFVGFAPYDNPRYAVAVVAEHAVRGSGNAYPIAREVMREAFERNSARQPNYQYATGPSSREKI
ncbi:penicillin-binding protein 2 [Ponticaulis profundi]|uniref:Penicillin-binding protein 2 n=1 Tax=Ponticaulis profundi TaxID=2665222 RepID=A0ABW1S670_9PROT